LCGAVADRAEQAADAAMPAYTHLQRAEPVLIGHWLLAYVEMFLRDAERLADCRKRVNLCPLGSGAVAGATVPLDRVFMANSLGFDGATGNSIDELRFVLTKPLMRLEIPDTPYLDLASTPFFAAALKSSNYFLGYGSGGSTVLACQLGKPLISIDSDRKFLNAVRRKLGGGLQMGDTVFQVANPFAFEEVEKLPECAVANHGVRGSRSHHDRRPVSRMLCADHDKKNVARELHDADRRLRSSPKLSCRRKIRRA